MQTSASPPTSAATITSIQKASRNSSNYGTHRSIQTRRQGPHLHPNIPSLLTINLALGAPTNPHPPLNRPPNRLHSLDSKPRAHLRRRHRRTNQRATNSPAVAHGPGELHRVGQDDGNHGHAGDIHRLRRRDCVFLCEVVY